LEKNLKLYTWYYAASSFIGFMPVFFLYFSGYLDLRSVIQLEAIYYISVVILEVPSGYFSDVVGRKKTLFISAAFLFLACIFYLMASSFFTFVLGQICFAGWMAFQSGTNTVFHYESLKAINKDEEYGDREALVSKYGMWAAAIAALIGGALATIDLSYAYWLTLIGATVALITSYQFKEPQLENKEKEQAYSVAKQIKTTVSYLKQKPLGWLFAYLILIYVLAHVPYEFYQPYLKLLENKADLMNIKAPFISGLLYALAMFIGSFAAGRSMQLQKQFGLKNLLVFSMLLMIVVVAMLGWVLHSVMILIILLRSVPRSLLKAPTNNIITPLIAAGQRATFHSMISLVCRLAFFMSLFGLSWLVPKDSLNNWPTLSMLFMVCAVSGLVLFIPVLLKMKNQIED